MVKHKRKSKSRKLLEEIELISKNYFYALKQIKNEQTLNDSNKGPSQYQIFVSRVKYAYHTLSATDQIFINNEFFFEDYPRWWEKSYTTSEFYRQRLKSMKNFKEALDNAY